jgi:hypothetical protein
MAQYRAYLIGDDGHFHDVVPLVCDDDAEAIAMAERLAIDHDVELDRKITAFSRKPKTS